MVRRMTIDHGRRLLEVEMSDGTVVFERGKSTDSAEFLRSEYDLERRELRLTLRTGEVVVAEVSSGDGDTKGRPVVYLDQCHWISLARHLHAPEKVSVGERDACERIVGLARAGVVLLPLSSAHLTETAPDGRWRRHLAVTMVTLSRGWQMHSPLRIRQCELIAQFRELSSHAAPPVPGAWPFSLAPGVLFDSPMRTRRPASDLPPASRDLTDRLSRISAIFHVMLENDDSSRVRAQRLAGEWAAGHQRLTDYMRDVGMGPQHSRVNATAALLADLRDEIATAAQAAGISPAQLARWGEDVVDALTPLPYLARLREVIYHRLRGAGSAWNANHLVDLMFLCAAAGYADVVVAERETADLLVRAGRDRSDGALVFGTLRDAVDAIEAAATRATPA